MKNFKKFLIIFFSIQYLVICEIYTAPKYKNSQLPKTNSNHNEKQEDLAKLATAPSYLTTSVSKNFVSEEKTNSPAIDDDTAMSTKIEVSTANGMPIQSSPTSKIHPAPASLYTKIEKDTSTIPTLPTLPTHNSEQSVLQSFPSNNDIDAHSRSSSTHSNDADSDNDEQEEDQPTSKNFIQPSVNTSKNVTQLPKMQQSHSTKSPEEKNDDKDFYEFPTAAEVLQWESWSKNLNMQGFLEKLQPTQHKHFFKHVRAALSKTGSLDVLLELYNSTNPLALGNFLSTMQTEEEQGSWFHQALNEAIGTKNPHLIKCIVDATLEYKRMQFIPLETQNTAHVLLVAHTKKTILQIPQLETIKNAHEAYTQNETRQNTYTEFLLTMEQGFDTEAQEPCAHTQEDNEFAHNLYLMMVQHHYTKRQHRISEQEVHDRTSIENKAEAIFQLLKEKHPLIVLKKHELQLTHRKKLEDAEKYVRKQIIEQEFKTLDLLLQHKEFLSKK